MNFTVIESPIGELTLVGCRAGLTGLYMTEHRHAPDAATFGEPLTGAWARAEFGAAIDQLQEYFAGERTEFDLPHAGRGTPFQRLVWKALCDVPYGQTISYAQLAARIGNPQAVRAVGLANGRNPISIVVPCHRVIGANGSLTGYGGGVDRKRFLLDLEKMSTVPALLP
ncbi:methylated-DNA--[protein]-cysteine S-methyltransferase [Saxibacter everestensis]|uniref:methylated-DNA--[protein]-cysteine S-methyltransferase n=1 Tax=Saxibacter everestensis TaxID=2909229 RepID=UPI0032E3584F